VANIPPPPPPPPLAVSVTVKNIVSVDVVNSEDITNVVVVVKSAFGVVDDIECVPVIAANVAFNVAAAASAAAAVNVAAAAAATTPRRRFNGVVAPSRGGIRCGILHKSTLQGQQVPLNGAQPGRSVRRRRRLNVRLLALFALRQEKYKEWMFVWSEGKEASND
jgi:hypothetical protein